MDSNIKKVVISGSSGLLGTALSSYLIKKGFTLLRLVRRPEAAENEIFWNPLTGEIDSQKLEGTDAAINFSGRNIGLGRWTKKRKKEIFESRVNSTRLLAETLSKLKDPPHSFISASAIGYYGDSGAEFMNEGAEPGTGFLPDLCVHWEEATKPAMKAGLRVVQMRSGVVLTADGGALAQMLPPFKMGVGGKLGNGKQYFSWIDIDDYVRAVYHLMTSDSIQSPVNVASPEPVTNSEFTAVLARVLRRPAFIPIPGFVLKLLFGQVAEEILLSSSRVIPQILLGSGFEFKYPDLENALRKCLNKPKPE